MSCMFEEELPGVQYTLILYSDPLPRQEAKTKRSVPRSTCPNHPRPQSLNARENYMPPLWLAEGWRLDGEM